MLVLFLVCSGACVGPGGDIDEANATALPADSMVYGRVVRVNLADAEWKIGLVGKAAGCTAVLVPAGDGYEVIDPAMLTEIELGDSVPPGYSGGAVGLASATTDWRLLDRQSVISKLSACSGD